MPKYASGKYAKAISDRSGLEFPYNEMVKFCTKNTDAKVLTSKEKNSLQLLLLRI